MALFSLAGRVVRATDAAPLAGVSVRLHGPLRAFAGLEVVQTPLGRQLTWTRQLSGFAGTRWDCWVKHVQNQVPGISWDQFRDGALRHNPGLQADGRLFKANQTYVLPEESAAPDFTWTRQLTDFTGTRWDCWTKQVQNTVPTMTWNQFCDSALAFNPQLNDDGRIFQPGKSYLVPQPDSAVRGYLEVETDADGNYHFELGEVAVAYELQVEVANYSRFVLPLMVTGVAMQPIQLTPHSSTVATIRPSGIATSGTVRSTRPDYPILPDKARRVIDMALFMLGEDARTFDALPADLQKMCYGARFLNKPNDLHYKDIVCADLVSIVLKGAGLDMTWSSRVSPNAADYYMPDGNGKLLVITNPDDWLPGDILLYGPSTTGGRQLGHVNIYVGAFAGTDRSGRTYTSAENVEVVDASMDFISKGKEVGTGIQGRPLATYCLDKRCYTYAWAKHIRLRELAAAFGRV